MIRWQVDASSENDFDFEEEPKKVGRGDTFSICLTKDEKYLLVGSRTQLSILETNTRRVAKKFNLNTTVRGIFLIKDGKKAIIAEEYGVFTIIDLQRRIIYSRTESPKFKFSPIKQIILI